MLHYTAIDDSTLELLKELLAIPYFDNLYLVGGTSLALQIGHRKSIDLDLFGKIDADDISISQSLNSIGRTRLIKKTPNIQIYVVNDIKVDIVNYHYPWLDTPIGVDQLRLAGKRDIAAMKLGAIAGRGSRKDFVDLYFLLKEFSLKELLSFYNEKYNDGSSFLVLKSLTYFDDADTDPHPNMLKSTDWKEVKQSIVNSVDTFLKSS
ncbi:MAG TPA: nucleotidyl transferase AbiEii/AbiGii toxin family protein [Bacteroidales bacterium]|nr:nucleotidyl transferase AbiEii/AbiGii toxin family protein [Bacteroidales bacterium]